MTPKTCDSQSLPVQARRRWYFFWSMYTNICLDVCDSKGSRLESAHEVYRVGRCDVFPEDGTPVPKHAEATLIMNCDLCFVFYCNLSSASLGQYIKYTKMHGRSNIKCTVGVA